MNLIRTWVRLDRAQASMFICSLSFLNSIFSFLRTTGLLGYTTLNPQINRLAFPMICIDFNILQNYLQVSTTYNQMIFNCWLLEFTFRHQIQWASFPEMQMCAPIHLRFAWNKRQFGRNNAGAGTGWGEATKKFWRCSLVRFLNTFDLWSGLERKPLKWTLPSPVWQVCSNWIGSESLTKIGLVAVRASPEWPGGRRKGRGVPAARGGPGVDQPEEHIGPFAKVALNVDRGPQAVQKGIKIAQI